MSFASVQVPKEIQSHGTRSRYRDGCHCDECRRDNAERQAKLRIKLSYKEPPQHGASGYTNYSCRCPKCTRYGTALRGPRIDCKIEGCLNRAYRTGLCRGHYDRKRKSMGSFVIFKKIIPTGDFSGHELDVIGSVVDVECEVLSRHLDGLIVAFDWPVGWQDHMQLALGAQWRLPASDTELFNLPEHSLDVVVYRPFPPSRWTSSTECAMIRMMMSGLQALRPHGIFAIGINERDDQWFEQALGNFGLEIIKRIPTYRRRRTVEDGTLFVMRKSACSHMAFSPRVQAAALSSGDSILIDGKPLKVYPSVKAQTRRVEILDHEGNKRVLTFDDLIRFAYQSEALETIK